MDILLIGLLLFLVSHLVPSFDGFRGRLISALGNKNYAIIFSVVSLVSVVLIVYGFKNADEITLFTPPSWGDIVTFILTVPAVYLFMSNSAGSAPSTAQAVTAHPLSWGVVLWSIGHLISNGEAATVALFSTFLLVGLASILTGNRRGLKPRKEKRPPIVKELVFLVIVGVVYAALIWGHSYIAGVKLI